VTFLPYGRQSISEADIQAVVDVLRSDYLTTGPMVDRFEAALSEAVGAKEAVVVANGTAALHLAALAQNLTLRDVVVVPSITFVASANCVAYCGGQVMFADVDPLTGLITDAAFDEAVASIDSMANVRFAGVIPVHYAGRPVDLRHMAEVCRARNAFLIEDACHAIGTTGTQGTVGSCQASDMACFSFHPVKTLTTGEGGAITTNDPEKARFLRMMRSHGIERDPARFVTSERGPWVYEMQRLGFNYRLPDMNCALGLSQLSRLAAFAAKRAALVAEYRNALSTTNIPVTWAASGAGEAPVFHLFAVNIDFDALNTTRTQVMDALKARGIGSQVHYIPVHRQPYWQDHALVKHDLPGADEFYRTTLSLPLYADMQPGDPARVIKALQDVLTS